ncbi:MAG: hypothetical protein M3Y22_14205, partial [Pseudomonadota bacterium]|nr:hypothetical protein [Pseudomonadota bacterium]
DGRRPSMPLHGGEHEIERRVILCGDEIAEPGTHEACGGPAETGVEGAVRKHDRTIQPGLDQKVRGGKRER